MIIVTSFIYSAPYPPICKRFPYVMFYLWWNSSGVSLRMRCLRSMRLSLEYLWGNKASLSIELLIQDAVVSKSDFESVFCRITQDFRDEEMWADGIEYLSTIFMNLLCVWSKSLPELMSESLVQNCLESFTTFCLRSMCGSKGDECGKTVFVVMVFVQYVFIACVISIGVLTG